MKYFELTDPLNRLILLILTWHFIETVYMHQLTGSIYPQFSNHVCRLQNELQTQTSICMYASMLKLSPQVKDGHISIYIAAATQLHSFMGVRLLMIITDPTGLTIRSLFMTPCRFFQLKIQVVYLFFTQIILMICILLANNITLAKKKYQLSMMFPSIFTL